MSADILLCTDLDRTLLPNGPQPESPRARPLLHALAQRRGVLLAYVTGRHLELLQEAIRDYRLPLPQFAIGDVGTTLYTVREGHWQAWDAWTREIAADWNGLGHDALAGALAQATRELTLQEPEKQNLFKLSYYAPEDADRDALLAPMRERLQSCRVHANLVWSVDEVNHLGLLDVLPARASKLHAIRFLMEQRHIGRHRMVFAGDSGNDLEVLTSGLQAVLVANAREQVRREAVAGVQAAGCEECLYLARGDWMGMNGNYCAGVLEGLVHFIPECAEWLQAQASA